MRKGLQSLTRWVSEHRATVALGLILLVAVFFRFWQLNSLPPGLHPDEAANGLDIVQRILHGDIRPLYNTNGPRESLFFFLQTIFVLIFGNTALALRIAPASIGVVAVFLTYLWVKDWFNKRTALLAALFTASGSWSVTIGRDGFRANMIPLMIALVAWLTTKAIKQKRLFWWVLAGAAYGAGFYTYIAWQVTPLIVAILLVMAAVKLKSKLRLFIKPFLAAVVAGLIVITPMAVYGLRHPGDVIGGRSSVSFTNPGLNNGRPLKTLLSTVGKTALMFNWRGDPNYRQNLGGAPELNALVGVMFLFGVVICLVRLKDSRYFSLLLIFGVMLIPEILTAEGIPHGLRAIGAIPAVYILASVGIVEAIERWRVVFPKNPSALAAMTSLLVLVIALALVYDYQRYFVAWANDPNTFNAYSEDATQMATYLNTQRDFSGSRYVVIDGYSDKTIEYLTYHKTSYSRIEPDTLAGLPITGPELIVAVQSAAMNVADYLQMNGSKFTTQPVNSAKRPYTTLYTVYQIIK